MKISSTTKSNLLHTLKEQKKNIDSNPAVYDHWLWDEYDLPYLIKLVEKDLENKDEIS
jgi:hypothetical protein